MALLELLVAAIWIVGVAVPEKGASVIGEGFQFAFCGVDVGFVVSEAGIYAAAGCGGNILFFDAHLVELGHTSVICSHRKLGNMLMDVLFGHTNSLASSSDRSANRTADFLGSPDSSVIWSSFWLRSAWTSLSSDS